MLSVVMPTLDAARHLPRALPPLLPGLAAGMIKELIVSDGGSADDTRAIAEGVGAVVVEGARGRGPQLIAGAAAARAPWLLFLHADTALAPDWVAAVGDFIGLPGAEGRAAAFRFAFDDPAPAAKRVEALVALRCALFKLPYGDQGLLISRALYDALGGYRPLPLMEDVDLVRRIGRKRLSILSARAVTSAEKHRRDGYLRRSLGNLTLLARYLAGADPAELAKRYR